MGFWGSAFKKFFALFLAKKKAPHKAVPFLTFIHWEILIIFIIPKTENIFNMHFRPIFAPISRLFISLDRLTAEKRKRPLTSRRGAEKAFPCSSSQGRIFQALTGRTPVIFLYILFGFFRKRLSAFRFFFPSRSKSHQSRRYKKQILRAPPPIYPTFPSSPPTIPRARSFASVFPQLTKQAVPRSSATRATCSTASCTTTRRAI